MLTENLTPSTTRENLELLELDLRIHELQTPWWRRLSVTAPLATIAIALLSLTWSIASGFFVVAGRELDISRRELERQIRQLEQIQVRQAREFRIATDEQGKKLRQLQTVEAELRAEVYRLDRPILLRTDIDHDRDSMDLEIRGENLGDKPGRAKALCWSLTKRENIEIEILTWSDSRVKARLPARMSSLQCATIEVVRSDGKTSNAITLMRTSQGKI